MASKIRVVILDDHQSIIDGYQARLEKVSDMEIVATIHYGDELQPTLARHPVDVLLLDFHVPNSASDPNPFPILHWIPQLLQIYPDLDILVISMHSQRTMIKAVMEAGASGYILKDDYAAIKELPSVIRSVASGGIHLSQQAYQLLSRQRGKEIEQPLTPRQIEALSLAAAYPNASLSTLAQKMNIANSTMRNLLSGAYVRLNVRTRSAAISEARQLGLIPPETRRINLEEYGSAASAADTENGLDDIPDTGETEVPPQEE